MGSIVKTKKALLSEFESDRALSLIMRSGYALLQA